MKDWEDVIKQRLAGRKAELPESDWNDFLSRKAGYERAAQRRRRLIALSVSIPAAAAVLLLLLLVPFRTAVPENQISQNQPSEPQTVADSIATPVDTIVKELPPVVMEKPKVEIAQVKPIVKPEKKPEVKPQQPLFTARNSVKGSVWDFDSSEPMYAAAVMIYRINGADTTFLSGAATDENGVFVFENLEPGNYVASTRYIGYTDADKRFTIQPGDSISDLGKISIRGTMLTDIAAKGVVAKVQMVNDTAKFNMAVYRVPEGSSVEELIRNLPGVQIDSAGNITVNGKAVNRILVNGKEFFNDDKTVALTQLTADMIEKVKAYEKNSDLSRQTGIDDGREDTELDFVAFRGMVYDFDTSEPLSNASVHIYRVTRKDSTFICSTLTWQDGTFGIYNIDRGKYVARISLEGYNNCDRRFRVRSGSRIKKIVKISMRRINMTQ